MLNRRIGYEGATSDWLVNLEKRIRSLETQPSGNIVIRDALRTIDPVTGAETILGTLPDGSTGLQQWVNDVTPPAKPSTPTASVALAVISVAWDGFDYVGNPPPADYDKTVVQMSAASTGPWTTKQELRGGPSTAHITGEPYNVEKFFRLISLDMNGNQSVPSSVVSATPLPLVEAPDISAALANLNTIATGAQTTADGKNTVYYQTSAPTGGTYRTGDTWFDIDDGNKIYVYSSGVWTASELGTNAFANLAITNAKIATLDAAKISTGILNALRIGAKSITTDKLVITSTDNLILEADFSNNGASWDLGTYNTINATAGRGSLPAMRVTGDTSMVTMNNLVNKISVGEDGRFRGGFSVKSSSALTSGRVELRAHAYTTATAFTNIWIASSPALVANTWTNVSGISDPLPAGTIALSFYLTVINTTTGTITDIDYVSVTRAADATLVVDGAIDGKTITGATVRTAASGARVVLDTTGLKAYDSSNALYLSADSTGLTLTGLLISKGSTDEVTPRPMAARIGRAVVTAGGSGTPVNFPSIWFDLDDSHGYSYWEPPSVSSHTGSGIEMKSGMDSTFKYASVRLGTGSGGGANIYAVNQIDMYTGVDGAFNIGGVDQGTLTLQSKDVTIQSLYGSTGLALTSTSNMTLDATTSVKINGRQVGMANYLEYVQTQNGVADATVTGPAQPSSYSRSTDTGIAHWSANDTLYFDKKGVYNITFTININAAATGRTFCEFSMAYDGVQIARNTVFAGEDTVTTSATVKVNVGETVTFKYYQTSGGTRTVESRIKVTRVSDI